MTDIKYVNYNIKTQDCKKIMLLKTQKKLSSKILSANSSQQKIN